MDQTMKQFNVMQAYEKLTQSGMAETEAKALIEVLEGASHLNAEVATKTDIAATKADIASTKADIAAMKGDIAVLRAEMREDRIATKAEIATVRTEVVHLEARMNARMDTMTESIHWLQRLFFGSTCLILVNIAINLVHH